METTASQAEIMWRRLHAKHRSQGCERMSFYLQTVAAERLVSWSSAVGKGLGLAVRINFIY